MRFFGLQELHQVEGGKGASSQGISMPLDESAYPKHRLGHTVDGLRSRDSPPRAGFLATVQVVPLLGGSPI